MTNPARARRKSSFGWLKVVAVLSPIFGFGATLFAACYPKPAKPVKFGFTLQANFDSGGDSPAAPVSLDVNTNTTADTTPADKPAPAPITPATPTTPPAAFTPPSPPPVLVNPTELRDIVREVSAAAAHEVLAKFAAKYDVRFGQIEAAMKEVLAEFEKFKADQKKKEDEANAREQKLIRQRDEAMGREARLQHELEVQMQKAEQARKDAAEANEMAEDAKKEAERAKNSRTGQTEQHRVQKEKDETVGWNTHTRGFAPCGRLVGLENLTGEWGAQKPCPVCGKEYLARLDKRGQPETKPKD